MKHEGKGKQVFRIFFHYIWVVAGVALSHSLITLYFFYELMTLATPAAGHACHGYQGHLCGQEISASFHGGAAMVFVSIISLHEYGTTLDFTWGGVIPPGSVPCGTASFVRRIYSGLLRVWGKGSSGPVSQLASRCVGGPHSRISPSARSGSGEGGVFALMRVVYWCFRAGFLIGTKVQAAVLCVCCITIPLWLPQGPLHTASETQAGLFYCKPAVLYPYGRHAYDSRGLAAGLTHMVCHALMKITPVLLRGSHPV